MSVSEFVTVLWGCSFNTYYVGYEPNDWHNLYDCVVQTLDHCLDPSSSHVSEEFTPVLMEIGISSW